MNTINTQFKRIAVKVGSNVITQLDGSLNTGRMLRIVEDIAALHKQGVDIVLITSGAVAAGRGDVVPTKRTDEVSAKQMWAAIGQVKLMSNYQFLFGKYGIVAGQVLAAKESFSDRRHYLNMRNCISALLDNKIIPVVNENDTISISELMFTDNDELSGMIASMMGCDSLIILSNVDGIFTGIPGEGDSTLIREVDLNSRDVERYIAPVKSGFGRGGMLTKYSIARKVSSEGTHVYIANGTRDSILSDIVRGKDVPNTHFLAADVEKDDVRKWLSHSEAFAKGAVYVNNGAKEALCSDKASSLLLIGVEKVEGLFSKGDIIRILDSEGEQVGIGKSQYDSETAESLKGEKRKKPLIYYNYMLITE